MVSSDVDTRRYTYLRLKCVLRDAVAVPAATTFTGRKTTKQSLSQEFLSKVLMGYPLGLIQGALYIHVVYV